MLQTTVLERSQHSFLDGNSRVTLRTIHHKGVGEIAHENAQVRVDLLPPFIFYINSGSARQAHVEHSVRISKAVCPVIPDTRFSSYSRSRKTLKSSGKHHHVKIKRTAVFQSHATRGKVFKRLVLQTDNLDMFLIQHFVVVLL